VCTVEELDVSGTLPIGRRPHLEAAVEDLEAGRAEVLLTPYEAVSSGWAGRLAA
jgi:hypothetical protein